MAYLGLQLREAGFRVHVLECGGQSTSCYYKEVQKNWSKLQCLKCRAGAVSTFLKSDSLELVGPQRSSASQESSGKAISVILENNVFSLLRADSPELVDAATRDEILARTSPTYSKVYEATLRWLSQRSLDFVLLFNGRQDLTRAVMNACLNQGVRVLTVERTWLGHGLSVNVDENCLSLKRLWSLWNTVGTWPLTPQQLEMAFGVVGSRFGGKGTTEWRDYHRAARLETIVNTKARARKKIVVFPSSKSEQLGEADWASAWSNFTDAFGAVIRRLREAEPWDVVVRAHPNWARTIGRTADAFTAQSYRNWCEREGFEFLSSETNVPSAELIAESDAVLLNGSSAAYEAALLGVPIINLGPCHYSNAGFTFQINDIEKLESFSLHEFEAWKKSMLPREATRMALRFIYHFAFRFPLFSNDIRAKDKVNWHYSGKLDTNVLLRLVKDPESLELSDDARAPNTDAEAAFLENYDIVTLAQAARTRLGAPSAKPPAFTYADFTPETWVGRAVRFARSRLRSGDEI
jgi:hypothetical protein